jgi:proline iminopeptidase
MSDPMTPAVERFVDVGDARLWSVSTGSGPAIVMVNGGPGCDDYLGPVAEMLSDNHRVIRVEPRGCGRSSWDGRYQFDTTVDDLDLLRDAYGIDRWVLCGHTAGADVALVYALRYRQRTVGVIGLAGGRMVNDREWSRHYHEQLATRGEEASQTFHSDPRVNEVGNRDWKALVQQPDPR